MQENLKNTKKTGTVLDRVGNTPLVRLLVDWQENINFNAKLEFYNPTGSVKDRAASYILEKIAANGEINNETTIIESSSGNFGVALSAYCKSRGLPFISVVDPHISPVNEMLICSFGARVIKVTEPDENGGYLLNRIKKVKELRASIPNSYWVNQYGNPYNAEAYNKTLGAEICAGMKNIDYLFLGISSGGTITGVSQRVKEEFPNARVVAVDIVGSVIFNNPPKKRYIPGIGSSMVPSILQQARIDEVIMMDEVTTIHMCHELLSDHYIFAGGSSGSVYGAIKGYFQNKKLDKPVDVVTIFPDRGDRYASTVYNEEWCKPFIDKTL